MTPNLCHVITAACPNCYTQLSGYPNSVRAGCIHRDRLLLVTECGDLGAKPLKTVGAGKFEQVERVTWAARDGKSWR